MINQDIKNVTQKKSVKEYVMNLFNIGLSKEDIEERVTEYFKKKEKKKDRKI